MINDIAIGIRTWFDSWRFISRHNLWHYFLYPFGIALLWYMGMFAFIAEVIDYLWVNVAPGIRMDRIPGGTLSEQAREVLANIAKYAMAAVVAVLLFLTAHKLSKYIILIAMSPVMSLLSERVNDLIEGRPQPFSTAKLIRDIVRGSILAIRNLFLELLLVWGIGAADILMTMAVPPLGVLLAILTPLATFLVGAYFFGFSALDYTCERNGLGIRESIRTIRKNKGVAIGNGAVFALLFTLPLMGTTIATITCTVGAALALEEKRNLSSGSASA